MLELKDKKVIVKKGQLIENDNYLFHEGKNYNSYRFMGAHNIVESRKRGIRFTTWAPKASSIYIVGDFNNFNIEDKYKLEKITAEGIWSIFIPNLRVGCIYKYYIVNQEITRGIYKADPYGYLSELRPNTSSIVKDDIKFKWTDRKWINSRKKNNLDESPMNIYEVHLGSWKAKKVKLTSDDKNDFFTYDELAIELPQYVLEMGYTHVELMPLSEYPLDASWGYQGVGYYAPTSRYGTTEGLKELINNFHKNGIGVILDWVPGHFCKDEHGLYMFDGTPTYEYEEHWKANNKGWGTFNFDLGKPEVKSFLISNALYWIKEFHVDGLRVDAVSNMIYLNYGRNEGEWKPNIYGKDGCLEGIDFLRELNTAIFSESQGLIMAAEESTAWPNVCMPVEDGGLGFNFKWNMGWMNDTLKYIQVDPMERSNHQDKLTFSMVYNYKEKYILPISHDEVVHGKKSLVNKMWGDYWNKFAGFRLYMAYMIGHPGKKLIFMGSEFAQFVEWREHEQLEWNLINDFELHKKSQEYIKELNNFYKDNKSLWELDYEPSGFTWVDADNNEQSIISFIRSGKNKEDTLLFICNFTNTVHYDFRIGVPYLGEYKEVFNTDEKRFGGSGEVIEDLLIAENVSYNSQSYSLKTKIPPMAVSIIRIEKIVEINSVEDINIKEIDQNNKIIQKNKVGMKVLIIGSEAHPFIKTGGLGDVIGTLPKALKKLDVDVRVVIPNYMDIKEKFRKDFKFVKSFDVKVSWRVQNCKIFEHDYEGVKYYFIDNEYYFKREKLYGYDDDGEKFAFFNRAVLEFIKEIDWKADILHCNDWQTGMIPVLHKVEYIKDAFYKDMKTVFSIHNIFFKGEFSPEILPEIFGYDYQLFDNGSLELNGAVSFLKGALNYSDSITTVSKSYAEEIRTAKYGEGLDGLLRYKEGILCGIVNGLDYNEYNPENDKFIFKQYSVDTLEDKLKNKEQLQRELGLPVNNSIPMIGMVSRLTDQKGCDLIISILDRLLKNDVQIVILGTGDYLYEKAFSEFQEKYQSKVSANILFDNELAHKIYASSDMFLMPSLFEPCGLGQLIALRYGSIPIVRETGGLKDTISQYNGENGEGNGFIFENYNYEELIEKIKCSIEVYKDKKEWKLLVRRAMNSYNSWDKSAGEYKNLYKELICES